MKAYIGVDPGKTGAMALMLDNYEVSVRDWVDERTMYIVLTNWSLLYDIQAVAIEDTHVMKGNSAKSDTTFQQHCGAWKCLVKLAGFEPVMVTPQVWMKRRIRAKTSPTDKPSLGYVQRNYPSVELQGPKGGWKDGRSDAVCIAEWCRDYCKGGKK